MIDKLIFFVFCSGLLKNECRGFVLDGISDLL